MDIRIFSSARVNTALHQSRLTLRIVLLMMLFFFAKTAGLIHEEIHPFHHHTAECEVFQGMAHPVSDEVADLQLPQLSLEYDLWQQSLVAHFLSPVYPHFWGRAPPSVFS